MGWTWEYTYPQAPSMIVSYCSVLNSLSELKKDLKSRIKALNKVHKAALKNEEFKGDYYDEYIDRTDLWTGGVDGIISELDNRVVELSTCITSVNDSMLAWDLIKDEKTWTETADF